MVPFEVHFLCLLGELGVVCSRSASISLTAVNLRCFLFWMLPSAVRAALHNSFDDRNFTSPLGNAFLSFSMDLDGGCRRCSVAPL
jgi:hypothetical protein